MIDISPAQAPVLQQRQRSAVRGIEMHPQLAGQDDVDVRIGYVRVDQYFIRSEVAPGCALEIRGSTTSGSTPAKSRNPVRKLVSFVRAATLIHELQSCWPGATRERGRTRSRDGGILVADFLT